MVREWGRIGQPGTVRETGSSDPHAHPGPVAPAPRQRARVRLLPLRGSIMLDHPTCDRLAQLRWFGMVHALTEQAHTPDLQALTFEERLGLLVDREFAER